VAEVVAIRAEEVEARGVNNEAAYSERKPYRWAYIKYIKEMQ
jgi:hypothetical protein